MIKKSLFFFWVCLLMTHYVSGQGLVSMSAIPDTTTFEYHAALIKAQIHSDFAPDSVSQARADKMYGRWERFWDIRYCPDAPSGVSIFAPGNEALDFALRMPNSSACLNRLGFAGNWSNIGPNYNSYGCYTGNCQTSGRIMDVWVHPTDKNYLLAASASGGLWKTTNSGMNWYNITDAGSHVVAGTIGISNIAVNPLNTDIIYLSTNSYGISEYGGKYGQGLIYSTDGGNTWLPDQAFRTLTSTTNNMGIGTEIIKIDYRPNSQRLYVNYGNRIYTKVSPTSAWTDITPTDLTNKCAQYGYGVSDFEFTFNPTGQVVFATEGMSFKHHLFIYTENTNSWTSKELVFVANDTSCVGMRDIAISANNDVFINMTFKDDNLPHRLYRTGIAPGSPLNLVNSSIHRVARTLVVSPARDATLYLANCQGWSDCLEKSTDGGVTWTLIGETHADCRSILIDVATNTTDGIDDVIYCGTDGGVARKQAGSFNLMSLVGNGLVVAQFSALSTSPSHGYIIAGAIDNGNQNYMKDRAQPWQLLIDGDGLVPAFSRNGNNAAYTQTQDGVSNRWNFDVANNTANAAGGPGNPNENFQVGAKWWKPMKFDNSDNARLGWHWIWRRALTDPAGWAIAFGTPLNPAEPMGTGPVTDSALASVKFPRDFIISELNPSIGYIAYCGNGGDITQQDDKKGKLFRSDELHTSTPTWVNITPPWSNDLPITDIEIDPSNPARIWVAYGAIKYSELSVDPAQRSYRVFYHANYGDKTVSNWINVSKGLPGVPVTKILYVEGSDDILFVGTDIGVYRWDKYAPGGGRWECFRDGMPRCMISDMELDYCSGKLKVSTFGRGVWETDYRADIATFVPFDGVHVISSNTTWNSSKTISASVRVKTGNTLTITGDDTRIYMPRKGRILVEPGARLIIDGATITNECGELWQGIQVAGSLFYSSDAAYQGYLELRNGATLEHARCAITNFADVSGHGGGGIIKASNSHIDNCVKAVALNHYPVYSYAVGPGTSNCVFDNVTFIKNDRNIPIDQMGYFASWDIKGGVVVKNCTFLYDIPWNDLEYNKRYLAMDISATGITIRNNTFDGFKKGVYASGYTGTPSRTVTVLQNDFNHISENITMAGNCYGAIKSNTVRNMYPFTDPVSGIVKYPIGIYLGNTLGAFVGCSNHVDGTVDGGPNPWITRCGFATFHTGSHPTTVIDNRFTNLSRGIQPQMGNSGLDIHCNRLEGNTYGFAVNPETSYQPNTLKNQGTGCLSTDLRAGNTFSSNFIDVASFLVNPWTYYAGNVSNQVPSTLPVSNVTVVNCTTLNNPQCNNPRNCITEWDGTNFPSEVGRYKTMVGLGQKNSLEGRILFGELIRAFNELDDIAGLQQFLEDENDDDARRLLIPLYIERELYSKADSTILALNVSTTEKQAYGLYYGLLAYIQQNGLAYDSLNPDQLNNIQNLAADSLEVSGFAKGYLEHFYGQEWEHRIEDIPMSAFSSKQNPSAQHKPGESQLINASPNPAAKKTTIQAYVAKEDAGASIFIFIRDLQGREYYQSVALMEGNNSIDIDLNKFSSGMYFYSLMRDGKAIDTKKLTVER